MKNIYFLLILIILLPFFGVSQSSEIEGTINWTGLIKEKNDHGGFSEYMYFTDAFTDMLTNLPLYSETIPINSKDVEITTEFTSSVFEPCTEKENNYLNNIGFAKTSIPIKTSIAIKRKTPLGVISFIPVRLNSSTNKYEKLVSFKILANIEKIQNTGKSYSREYADNSVLSTGEWYKIQVEKTGIYKITYNDLQNYGIDPSAINPMNIKIFGNSDGMLPEKNSLPRIDDLKESPIVVIGESDGVFDEDDYILFYGKSPQVWNNILGFFTYVVNYYTDYNYYYLTVSEGDGKRPETQPSSTLTPNRTISKFNDYKVIEDEKVNLILSGKVWYGDVFGEINNRQYEFVFPEIDTSEPAIIKMEIANRTLINEYMAVNINDDNFDTVILTSISSNTTKYAQKKKKTIHHNPTGPNININLQYLPSTAASRAWLDYIMVNAISHLKLSQGQLSFRELSSVEEGVITKFILSGANSNTQIWDVTNPLDSKIIESEINGDELYFTVQTDSLREFIAFDNSLFYTPEFIEKVETQNLHGEGPFDMVIIYHPLFEDAANRLAFIHDSLDGLVIKSISVNKVYNEFSSGKQDPTAIRDYMKMLYDKYEGQEPRFLVLFGDGSFDPKDRMENNSNFIPAFQNKESLVSSSSYVIDDYFGLLDDTEGDDAIGDLDIGIGRFPVQTIEEAQIVINKIERYLTKGETHFGKWRTNTCMIADDEDGNLHLEQADSLANGFIPDVYNQKKIYLDAYHQISTPSGKRYPDVTVEINKQIENGVLILNYVGHGGKSGWADERIIQTPDIQGWRNYNKLPVFITATCEFSRFDEPELNTGGEMVLLNPNGGGIALFTTTRLAYSQSNFSLNQRLYANAFVNIDGEMPYLGDLIRLSKPPGQLTTRNFVLLGDPALKMAYPQHNVKTTEINGINPTLETDTIKALEEITVTGEITDLNGNKIPGFNGIILPVIYDKSTKYQTIGNDENSYPIDFYCQDIIIWQGKDTVANGEFSFSFVVPKDIAYNFGKGKISYYAFSDKEDAFGYSNDFIIGGLDENAESDTEGPVIDLFLNDLSFVSGEQTHDSPVMLAFISDIHGLNLSANGMGHSMTLVLDEDYYNSINLSEYFEPDINSYKSGSITYPFYNLPDGKHSLKLKAWDSYNNSSETTIEFYVNSAASIELSKVINFPNPFKNYTTFTFNHTRPGDELKIELDIYDLTGKLVLAFKGSVETENTNTPFFKWYGDDLNGNRLRSGIYLYTIKVTGENGSESLQRQKLIIVN